MHSSQDPLGRQHYGMPERAGMSLERRGGSGHVFDDLDELVDAVTLAAGEVDKLSGTLDDRATFRRSCNGDAAPASELE